MRKFWFVWVLIIWFGLVFSSNILASDFAELEFIGFSRDGRYLAFAESGDEGESSRMLYASTYLVDTIHNKLAVRPLV